MDPHAPFDLLRTDGMQIRACEMHQRMHFRSISLFSFSFCLSSSFRLASLIFVASWMFLSPARLLAVSLRSQPRREVIFITDHGCHLLSRPRLTVTVRECKYRVAKKIAFRHGEYSKAVNDWQIQNAFIAGKFYENTEDEITTCNNCIYEIKHYRSCLYY